MGYNFESIHPKIGIEFEPLGELGMSAQDPVFIVYHPSDREWVDRFLQIAGNGDVAYWDGSTILPGTPWMQETSQRIEKAPACLLFLSPDITSVPEYHMALERAEVGCPLLIFAVRPLRSNTPLMDVKPLYPLDSPLEDLSDVDQDRALDTIAKAVKRAILKLRESDKTAPVPATPMAAPLRLKRLTLSHIRCFEHLELDFGQRPNCTLLLGDNATGKTSLLRALALGLCQETSAAALISLVPGGFIMKGHNKGRIEVELCDTEADLTYKITTDLTRKGREEQVRQITSDDFPWHRVFLCAYGTERSSYAIGYAKAYTSREAVTNLFDYKTELFDPEAVLKSTTNLEAQNKLMAKIQAVLRMSDQHPVVKEDDQFQLKGPWGQQPFKALSDGYRGTIQWVLDLLGRHMLAREGNLGDRVEGIILVDEIDQHLHPKWQQHFLRDLMDQFPDCQFVATTHSPLLAANLNPERSENKIWCLGRRDHKIVLEPAPKLKGYTVDQVLGSFAFDYVIQTEPELAAVLREASILSDLGTQRDSEQEKRYQEVVQIIEAAIPPDGTTSIERDGFARFRKRLFADIERLKKAVYGSA